MRLHHLCLILLNVFGINNGQKNVRIRALKSQQNVPIAWNKYNYIIVGSKGSKDHPKHGVLTFLKKKIYQGKTYVQLLQYQNGLRKHLALNMSFKKAFICLKTKFQSTLIGKKNSQNQTTYICIRLFLLYARTHTQTTLLK